MSINKSQDNKGEIKSSRWGRLFLVVAVAVIAILILYRGRNEQGLGEQSEVKKDGLAQVQTVQAAQFDDLAASPKVFVIDVHTPEQAHLRGTDAFIPFDEIKTRASELPQDKSTTMLVYCRSGHMSQQAGDELAAMGYQRVYDLEGGTQAYTMMKTPVELMPPTQDLGEVVYGEVARTQLQLINNSAQALEIKKISTSCSCTKAEVEEKQVEPYGLVTVNVSFDPAVHKDDQDLGEVTRTIFIETSQGKDSEVTASFSAKVVKR